jgi:methionyl-tRNA formyltransferase
MAEKKERLNIVFMGTPEFAAHILRKVAAWQGGFVSAVYTQPDRPAGRGHKLMPSAVKMVAQELGLPVLQPVNFKSEEARQALADLKPDILAVAAYGLILPQAVLDSAALAPLNVHGSLLPKYRGAAPIQRAIMDGEPETGVCIMHMQAALDAGAVYARAALPTAGHTAGSMHDALAELGGELLVHVLEQFSQGIPPCQPQDESLATFAPKITKAEGNIDWNRPCAVVDAHIRGVTPWPAARVQCRLEGKEAFVLTIAKGCVGQPKPTGAQAGELWLVPQGLGIATADALYMLEQVRPADRKAMDARAFANGYLQGCAQGLCGRVS